MNTKSKILLTKRDAEVFFDACFNPAPPNEALIEAAKRYNEIMSSSEK